MGKMKVACNENLKKLVLVLVNLFGTWVFFLYKYKKFEAFLWNLNLRAKHLFWRCAYTLSRRSISVYLNSTFLIIDWYPIKWLPNDQKSYQLLFGLQMASTWLQKLLRYQLFIRFFQSKPSDFLRICI